jgi:hypothetical protein
LEKVFSEAHENVLLTSCSRYLSTYIYKGEKRVCGNKAVKREGITLGIYHLHLALSYNGINSKVKKGTENK